MVDISKVPAGLVKHDNFVVWRMDKAKDTGRPTKIPYRPSDPTTRASSNNLDHTDSFAKAVKATEDDPRISGIGFVFHPSNSVVGVDIDHCVDESTMEVAPWAMDIVKRLDSYTEFSPSQTGLHIFIDADAWSGSGTNQVNVIPGCKIEMYCKDRFFTITGDHVPGTPRDVMERSEEWRELHAQLLADDKVVKGAMNRKDSDKFKALWKGDWTDEYGSQSEADLALCTMLMHAAAGDVYAVDRLFRWSGLMRDKWNENRGDATYGEVTIRKAKKSYEESPAARALDIGDTRNTERGNAMRLIQANGDDLIFCREDGKWYRWDAKGVWAKCSPYDIHWLIGRVLDGIMEDAKADPDRNTKAAKIEHVLKSESYQRIKGSELLARGEVMVSKKTMDTDPMILNVVNGTLDLKTGELMPHDKTQRLTKMANVVYDPMAECPTWTAFVDEVMEGDAEKKEYLRRAVGYTLTGLTDEQAYFFLVGVGANGKTTFLETLRMMLGDYAATSDPSAFMARNDTTELKGNIARLDGSRLVVSTETEEGRKMAESLMKRITGSDAIEARYLYQEAFEFQPTFKIWLAGNRKPEITGTDEGIWRRTKVINFTITIPEQKRNKKLSLQLRNELPGILNWALGGCLDWQRDGLHEPQAVRDATDEYRMDMDEVQQFIEECCNVNVRDEVPNTELYQAYVQWSYANRQKKELNNRAFIKRVKEKGFVLRPGHDNIRTWDGLSLLENKGSDSNTPHDDRSFENLVKEMGQ